MVIPGVWQMGTGSGLAVVRVDIRPDTDSRRAWAAQMPGVLAWDSPGGGHYCVPHRAQEARQRVPYEGLVGSESLWVLWHKCPSWLRLPQRLWSR